MNNYRFLPHVFVAVLLSWVVSLAGVVQAADEVAPGTLVENLFNEMNEKLQADKEIIEADRGHLLALGNDVLGPYVAFDKMAKKVLGKHWKKITKDQQARYTKAFKERVSLAMVSQYDPSKSYALKVTGERRNKKGNLVLVKSSVKELSGASSYLIDYKLYQNKKTQQWQVYDVIVEGISVLQSFKSASAEEIKKNGIEKLIEQLEVSPEGKSVKVTDDIVANVVVKDAE
ncbi:hypothetical protein A9Q81_19420 [Gammaproteobacteria bacterium 42_54_T18]|nr:hypothetical protein A9Q81_19420 [Gammaproteobacteria bacterium 42_54_T18]